MSQRHQNQDNRQQENQTKTVSEVTEKIKKANSLSAVLDPKDFAPIYGWADKITWELQGKIKSSQLRKVFNQIKQVCDKADIENKVELYLIYPNLVYAQARDLIPREFYNLLVACLDKLKESKNKEDFKRFGEFMTAIVAYNKRFKEKA